MFERTVSFWRRLVSGRAEGAADTIENDRRHSKRLDTDQTIQCCPANSAAGEAFTAKLRNVSIGGFNIAADRELELGSLISVELPSKDGHDPKTVLACVVFANQVSDKEWATGCTFAQELSFNDLTAFVSNGDDLEDDERGRPRYGCELQARCVAVNDDAAKSQAVKVLNLSTTGIAFHADRELAPGSLLNMDLSGANPEQAKSMLSCVVHVTKHSNDVFTIGCNFITEMAESDLKQLID